MSFAIPEELREYVDQRVGSGDYGNASEYLRDLIRRDRREHAADRFRSLIADGIASGEPRQLDAAYVAELEGRIFRPAGG
jgi:antitoxin ParD1/3/4